MISRRSLLIACLLAMGATPLRAGTPDGIEVIHVVAAEIAPPAAPPPTPAPERIELAQTIRPRMGGGDRETTPTPVQSSGADERAPVIIEKRGAQDPEEEEKEAPRPFWFFGGDKYITRSVRKLIDEPTVRKGRWRYIVVHNSGTRQGNARIFDYYHRRVRHMPNGLAYQFVIGNGNGSGNGKIEVGNRWRAQLQGGHCASDYLNNIAIGICLVGDFNRHDPTKAQLQALEELVNYLRKRVGRVDRQLAVVKGHKEINPKPTDCPGRRFPLRWLHRKFD